LLWRILQFFPHFQFSPLRSPGHRIFFISLLRFVFINPTKPPPGFFDESVRFSTSLMMFPSRGFLPPFWRKHFFWLSFFVVNLSCSCVHSRSYTQLRFIFSAFQPFQNYNHIHFSHTTLYAATSLFSIYLLTKISSPLLEGLSFHVTSLFFCCF